MIDLVGFRAWLHENTAFSDRTISNIVSRFKRANKMLSWFDDDIYMFKLSKTDSFLSLNTTVKSQVKSAVKYYNAFVKEKQEDECERCEQ